MRCFKYISDSCKQEIGIFNKYYRIFIIGYFIIIMTSCQTMFFPNTLAPAKTYSTGKGEVGIRTFYIVPSGADFKVGVTDEIQVSGIFYPINILSGAGVYEASLQMNMDPSEHDKYLHIFGVGGGAYVTTKATTGSNNQANYVYEGYYPGFVLTDHISVSLPLRMYEFMGRYNCLEDQCPRPGAKPLERYQGAAFVPEMDWCFEWRYVALRFGLSMPIQFWESYNPETVIILPDLSAGLYGKW